MERKRTKPGAETHGRARGARNTIAGSAVGRRGADRSSSWSAPRAVFLAAGLLLLAIAAAYSNSLRGPFVLDDTKSISENATIRHLWPIWPVLSPPAHGEAVQRRPVVNLSLAINYAVSGYDVWSYHAFNVAAHMLAALLLFGVVRRTLLLPAIAGRLAHAATPLALVAALLWAVHPLHTEALDYTVQRTEVFAAMFYLLTLYCVIRGSCARRPAPWYVLATAACALAMGSKESAISAPAVVLLFDRVFLSASWREVFRRRWGLYLGLAASWTVILIVLPHGGEGIAVFAAPRGPEAATIIGEGGGVLDYALSQCGVIAHYLRLCFWPHPLLFDYGFYKPQPAGQVIPYALLIGALLIAIAAAFRWQPWLGFLGVWLFAILAPSSSFVPLFQQYAAEKRMYLPLAAVATSVVTGGFLAGRWLVRRGTLSPQSLQIAGVSLAALTSVTLGILTFQRNADYRSDVLLWQDTVAKAPDNPRAECSLGAALAGCGRFDEAIEHLQKSLKIKPDYLVAYYNLGLTLTRCGRVDDAIAHYRKALELNPGYVDAHNNLGMLLSDLGRTDEAIAHYRAALRIDSNCAVAHNNLGADLIGLGQAEEAIVHFREAVRLNPSLAEAHNNLGLALCERGQTDEAIACFRNALRLRPDYAEAHYGLGNVLAEQGQYREAAAQYRRALELKPDFTEARENLDRALTAE